MRDLVDYLRDRKFSSTFEPSSATKAEIERFLKSIGSGDCSARI